MTRDRAGQLPVRAELGEHPRFTRAFAPDRPAGRDLEHAPIWGILFGLP